MPKKNTASTVKKYAPEASTRKKTPLAKVVIPQMPLADFRAKLGELSEKAITDNPEITRARGTIALY